MAIKRLLCGSLLFCLLAIHFRCEAIEFIDFTPLLGEIGFILRSSRSVAFFNGAVFFRCDLGRGRANGSNRFFNFSSSFRFFRRCPFT